MRQVQGFAQLSNQGSAVDPKFQTVDFSDSNNLPSISLLPLAMTIDGVTQSTPLFYYRGGDADGTGWNARTYGPNLSLTGAGTDPSYDQDTPLFGVDDLAVQFNAGKYYRNAATNVAFSTHDYVVEAIVRCDNSVGNCYFFDGRDSGSGFKGMTLYFSGSGSFSAPAFYIRGAGGIVTVSSTRNVYPFTWCHFLIFCNRDWNNASSCRMYLNGTYVGQSSIFALSGNDLSSTMFYAGASVVPAVGEGSVALAACYAKASWLPESTTKLDAFALERASELFGLYPQVATGTAVPAVKTRNFSISYLDRYIGTDRIMFAVSQDWIRTCYRKDSSNVDLYGVLIENGVQNKFTYTEEFNQAAWTKTGCTVSANSDVAPNGQTTMDSLIANNAAPNAQSTVREAPTLTAATYCASIFVKKGNRDHFFIDDTTIADGCAWFNLSTKVVGTKEAGVTSYIEDWGTWLRLYIVFTGTAAAHTIEFGACDADNSKACTGDGAAVSAYIWGAQVELGYFASSYIYNVNVLNTRIDDVLYYTADDGNVTNNKTGTMAFKCLVPNGAAGYQEGIMSISEDGLTTDRVEINSWSTTVSGAFRMTLAENVAGSFLRHGTSVVDRNTIYTVRAAWKAGSQLLYVNGAAEGADPAPTDIPDDITRITFGNSTGTSLYNILIQNLRIYDEFDVDV